MNLYVLGRDRFVFLEHSLTLFWHIPVQMSPTAQKLRHSIPKFSNLERVDDKVSKGIAVVQELGDVN